MITDLLTNKTAKEKANIKGQEIAILNHVGTFDAKDGLRIEIQSLKAIEVNGSHGVELLARAWKGGTQLGFSQDGSVEWERFRIFNPPILVADPNGTIIREWLDKTPISPEGVLRQRKLREDPIEAIRQELAHTISLVGKENAEIVKGKIGNTTSTFYPDSTETVSFDAYSDNDDGLTQHTWAEIGSTTYTARVLVDQIDIAFIGCTARGTGFSTRIRSFFLFDTSALPDTDTISSASFSVYGTAKSDVGSKNPTIILYATTPSSNTAPVSADYLQFGSTDLSDSIAYAAFSTTAYNDLTLNATGIAAISKTGVSKFGLDWANPANTTNDASSVSGYYADQTGTANDPKLVVVHSAAGGANHWLLMGV